MASPAPESRATLSVLDRLIDEAPADRSEPQMGRAESVRRVKASLRRDLEWLLNARRIAVEPPESLREVNRSLYMFGLPDLSSFALASEKEQGRLLKTLQRTVRLFEPRLVNVKVVATDTVMPNKARISFRIEGLLRMDPAPERVSFDTVLELTGGGYKVKGEADA